ncbi:MAG TPA: 16S rRNA (guanine(527)-N(7))-methyltransferase RsmG [bacterium]|nr:16S rRNA (guanine(527)-N(7))-methyltransferase RsmG [bacterium]
MEQNELFALLNEDLQTLGLSLPQGADAHLLTFLNKVLIANETMNLTSITDKAEAIHKHLIDSTSVLLLKSLQAQIPSNPQWVDVGSGAGFPGLALALAVPSATLHLVESTGKKAHFLNTLSAELGLLKRVKVYNERAEVLTLYKGSAVSKSVPRGTKTKPAPVPEASVPRGTVPSLRDFADGVFFRGVARLASLAELGAPFLKVGGLLVAYKGPKAGEELVEAAKAMKELKMELCEKRDFILPGVQEARSLICLRKTAETIKKFPRLVGLAQKEPLL